MKKLYVYYDASSKQYMVDASNTDLLGTHSADGKKYYFAAFTRPLDAYRYVQHENNAKQVFGAIDYMRGK